MTIKKTLYFFTLLVCQIIFAQNDSITILENVVVSDNQLKKFSNSQSVLKINDSIIHKNQASLTSLLNFNSLIYFKENGLGMVSSPSFRGTTAQQTAVIWNGININSQLNGQTDFNLISTKNFENIAVRSGGGSVIYGSSAIGGSVHLNNELNFKNLFQNEIQTSFGSFSTYGLTYKMQFSTQKLSSNFSFSRNSSKNDYPYLNYDLKNQNGEFYNNSFSFNFGYKWNNFNFIKTYNQVFDSNRNLSGTLAADSKSNYQDFTTKNLVEWISFQNKFTSTLKIAFLYENYKYFENKNSELFSFGKSESFILRYDINYKLNSKITLNSIIDLTQSKGYGSDIEENKRKVFSGLLLLKHQVFVNFLYELGIRKETTSNYQSPILFSFGTNYAPYTFYKIKANVSRNYRVPTFNDLYWQGLGNSNLKPESSFQVEIGNEISYNSCNFSITAYQIKLTDMIQWSPNSSGIWTPKNIKNVTSKGIETNFNFDKKYKNHHIVLNLNYGYTVSKDENENLQLIYVPLHKATFSSSYCFKKIGLFYQFLFNGKVFTSSDNENSLKNYKVSNAGIDFRIGTEKTLKIGFQINNLLNENYQSVLVRPMPGRNFNLNFNFKF